MRSYQHADVPVSMHRCAFGDDERGYCSERATEHIWCMPVGRDDAHTMACDAHREHVDHPVRDRHPLGGACGLPGALWFDSHPNGGPGWCELDGFDWLMAADAEASPASGEHHATVR
jgi:hypothetical protein